MSLVAYLTLIDANSTLDPYLNLKNLFTQFTILDIHPVDRFYKLFFFCRDLSLIQQRYKKYTFGLLSNDRRDKS